MTLDGPRYAEYLTPHRYMETAEATICLTPPMLHIRYMPRRRVQMNMKWERRWRRWDAIDTSDGEYVVGSLSRSRAMLQSQDIDSDVETMFGGRSECFHASASRLCNTKLRISLSQSTTETTRIVK